MANNGVKIIFGGAANAFLAGDVDQIKNWLDALEASNVKIIDTAQMYGSSEEGLGKAGAAGRFIIDTKYPGGFGDKPATKENIIENGQGSLERLHTKSVDIYYVHAPDHKTPIKDTLAGLNELYKQGAFKRLGLSNFSGQEIEEAHRVAKENGFVAPSVYQGNYSAVARHTEEQIFPVLRKHNMSFYAYSPIAGGFLSKSKENLTEKGGRFDKDHAFGKMYNGMYNKPSFVNALDTWAEVAESEKVTRAAVAYRWIVYHSKLQGDLGDGVIIGARNEEQLKETVETIKAGPLKPESIKKIEGLWDSVKDDSLLDNFQYSKGSS